MPSLLIDQEDVRNANVCLFNGLAQRAGILAGGERVRLLHPNRHVNAVGALLDFRVSQFALYTLHAGTPKRHHGVLFELAQLSYEPRVAAIKREERCVIDRENPSLRTFV